MQYTPDGVSFTQSGHTLKGAYRPLLSMPTNLTLHSSSSGSSSSSSSSKSDSSSSNNSSTTSSSAGSNDAVVCVSFDLQPGCFATMAMRELTKQDTDLVASSAERALAADNA